MSDDITQASKDLTEAQQYYIGLFVRWQKMSSDPQVKTDNPDLFEELKEVDFNRIIKYIIEFNLSASYNGFLQEEQDYFDELKSNGKFDEASELENNLLIDIELFRLLLKITKLDKEITLIVTGEFYLDESDYEEVDLDLFRDLYISGRIEDLIYFENPTSSLEAIVLEIENEKLKNELANIKENQNQIGNSKYKVFHFNQAILGEHKSSFAEYFMGLKDFVLYAQGKNIGVSIEVNGNLEVKIYSDNENDLDLVRDSIEDYILNLKNNGNEFSIRAGKTALDPHRALIYLQSKYFSLQTNLQLKNSELLQSQNANKFLESVYKSVISENNDLKKSNQMLLDDLNSAISKINTLKNELTKIKIQTLHDNLNKDPIENIINLLGSLSLVIDQKSDEGLVKKLINQLADYEKLNRDLFSKINLPEVNFKIGPIELSEDLTTISLSEIIQQITNLLYRKF